MPILALDLSLTTGWALRRRELTYAGVLDLRGRRYEGGGMFLLRFTRWLEEMRGQHGVDQVAFEEPRAIRGGHAEGIATLQQLSGVLMSFCEQEELPFEGVPIGTIKKRATGKGNASKDAVLAAAREKWPELFVGSVSESEDMADALWCLECATQETA